MFVITLKDKLEILISLTVIYPGPVRFTNNTKNFNILHWPVSTNLVISRRTVDSLRVTFRIMIRRRFKIVHCFGITFIVTKKRLNDQNARSSIVSHTNKINQKTFSAPTMVEINIFQPWYLSNCGEITDDIFK